jgi:hypothetical protein
MQETRGTGAETRLLIIESSTCCKRQFKISNNTWLVLNQEKDVLQGNEETKGQKHGDSEVSGASDTPCALPNQGYQHDFQVRGHR